MNLSQKSSHGREGGQSTVQPPLRTTQAATRIDHDLARNVIILQQDSHIRKSSEGTMSFQSENLEVSLFGIAISQRETGLTQPGP